MASPKSIPVETPPWVRRLELDSQQQQQQQQQPAPPPSSPRTSSSSQRSNTVSTAMPHENPPYETHPAVGPRTSEPTKQDGLHQALPSHPPAVDSPTSSLSLLPPRMRQPMKPPSSVSSSRSEPLLRDGDRPPGAGGGQGAQQDEIIAASDPASGVRHWLVHSAWPGLGLFGESYVLFSIGLLTPMWEVVFPDCWSGDACRRSVLQSITYSVVLGVISGMLGIGYLARRLGRRRGSLLTASLMTAGAAGLSAASVLGAGNPQALFLFTSLALFVFGVGVGGEYPLAASSASEAAMGEMTDRLKQRLDQDERMVRSSTVGGGPMEEGLSVIAEEGTGTAVTKPSAASAPAEPSRGRQVQLVFSMQGMGIFVNSLSMAFLLLVMGQTTDQYDRGALLLLWRLLYLFGAAVLLYVLVSRYLHLKESTMWLDDQRRREQLLRNSTSAPFSDTGGNPKASEAKVPYAAPSSHIYNNRISTAQAAHQPPTSTPYAIPDVPTNRSGFSDVSSLSAPSIEVVENDDSNNEDGICGIIKEVPSTEPLDDLRANDWSLLWRNYGARLMGTSLSWMLWDVAFYGNKLFQSSFLLALTGQDTTLFELALAATLNSFVALLGYFGAAAILDHPQVGRCRLQGYGFLLTGALFVGCGLFYRSLSTPVLVAMYLGSSFFGQLGPNATTFLIPAEIFPTEMRTVCHGISAASGKVGALLAAIAFHHMAETDMFLASGYASFAACLITFWSIPDTSGLDLYETDRRWRMILDGRKGEYAGEANHVRYLSFHERYKLRIQRRRHDSQAHLHSHFDAG